MGHSAMEFFAGPNVMDLTPHTASQVNNYNHKTAETSSQRALIADF